MPTGLRPAEASTASRKQDRRLYPVREVAVLFDVSRSTIVRAYRNEEFPAIKFRGTYCVSRQFVDGFHRPACRGGVLRWSSSRGNGSPVTECQRRSHRDHQEGSRCGAQGRGLRGEPWTRMPPWPRWRRRGLTAAITASVSWNTACEARSAAPVRCSRAARRTGWTSRSGRTGRGCSERIGGPGGVPGKPLR